MIFNTKAFEKIKTYKKLCTKIYIEKDTSKSNLKKLDKIEKQLQKNSSVDYKEILRLKNFILKKGA